MTKISDIAKASKSESFRKLNPSFFNPTYEIKSDTDNDTRVLASNDKPVKRRSLGDGIQGKAKGGIFFKICFTVYAVRPADWDGWHIKELQDLLVKSGVIPGDDWATLGGEVLSRKVKTKEEEKTVIEITQIN